MVNSLFLEIEQFFSSNKSSSHSATEQRSSGVMKTVLLLLAGFSAWIFQSVQPPPVKTFTITSPRIKLRDGRHLAYKEHGVSRKHAKFKIVYIHGFYSCRHDAYFANSISPIGTCPFIYLFYVLGFSMGGQITWSCLHYISHRLAGVTLVAPVINFWWRNLPLNISKEALSVLLPQDRWALRVAHYMPWLTYWWNTQRWFSVFSIISGNRDILCPQDMEILSKRGFKRPNQPHTRQQGEFESLHRDLLVGFDKWEFDPLDVQDPDFRTMTVWIIYGKVTQICSCL